MRNPTKLFSFTIREGLVSYTHAGSASHIQIKMRGYGVKISIPTIMKIPLGKKKKWKGATEIIREV